MTECDKVSPPHHHHQILVVVLELTLAAVLLLSVVLVVSWNELASALGTSPPQTQSHEVILVLVQEVLD